MKSSNLKFSEVQRKRAVSASTDSLASDTSDRVTCLSHDKEDADVVQSWDGVATPLVCKPARGSLRNRSQYQLRSSNLARQTAILPSKVRVMPTPTSKPRPTPVPTPSSKPSRLIGKSVSDHSIRCTSVSNQGYDFTPFVKKTLLDDYMSPSTETTPR